MYVSNTGERAVHGDFRIRESGAAAVTVTVVTRLSARRRCERLIDAVRRKQTDKRPSDIGDGSQASDHRSASRHPAGIHFDHENGP